MASALGGVLLHCDVDGPHQLEDDADGVGGVQVIVHGVVELLAVAVKGLGEGLLLGGHVAVGAVLGQELQVALGGVEAFQGVLRHDEGVAGVVQGERYWAESMKKRTASYP